MNILQYFLYSKFKIFIQENSPENIACEIAAIISQPQYVISSFMVKMAEML